MQTAKPRMPEDDWEDEFECNIATSWERVMSAEQVISNPCSEINFNIEILPCGTKFRIFKDEPTGPRIRKKKPMTSRASSFITQQELWEVFDNDEESTGPIIAE